jgi:inosine-uridine nucleoside N-ribohydrolase
MASANHPQPVEILAIGSMTNIASVITVRPELKHKIKRVISMGGAIDVSGNLRVHGFTHEHTNTQAEWNFYIDPFASKIVLESGIPITLVPLDATNQVPLTNEFVERAQQTGPGDASGFVGRVFQKIKESTTNGDYYHWDPLAAAIASKPQLCKRISQTRLTTITDVGSDDGVDQGLASEEFPLTNGMGNLRRPLNEHAAGATVRSA